MSKESERAELRQVRAVPTNFQTRELEDGTPIIEGYFAVFGDVYQIGPGMSESIAPGAFTEALDEDDVRALINHDTTLVLGRNTAGTLALTQDEHGLFGTVQINPNDRSAMDCYARVQRGDVSGCSFGFEIAAEDTDISDDGSVHWTITKVKPLYEVSCCTFPAYPETNIEARSKEREELRQRKHEAWKATMLKKLKGE